MLDATFQHWAVADSVLPSAHPLVLFSDTTLAAAKSLFSALQSQRTAAVELRAAADWLVHGLREKQRALREWHRFYNRAVRGSASGLLWERLLSPMPHEQCAPHIMRDAAAEVGVFWRALEAHPPQGWPGPLRRADGSVFADFLVEIRAFDRAMEEVAEAKCAADVAESDAAWTREQLALLVSKYPAAVASRFRPGHRLLDSVPKPWPQEKR